jgi:hypothetical protein
MSALIKRAYSRDAYETPIMFANYDTEKYYHAKMYNRSLEVCISNQKKPFIRDQTFVLRL